jgi:hypothetical protein
MCLESIKTPYSWSFQVTKFCILEYNVRNQKHNYNSFHVSFCTTYNSHDKLNMEIIVEACISLVY